MDYNLPARVDNSNKSTYGKVLNVAGSDYMPGAAYLSSVPALKIGCGYCFLASTERVIDAVAAQTQNIVFTPVEHLDKNFEIISPDVVSIGCGLSQSRFAVEVFLKVLNLVQKDSPLIIDADGLNILSQNKDGFDFKNVILTPHPKEAARLLSENDLNRILEDIEGVAKKISGQYNSTVVLKTHKTVVVSPDGKVYHNTTGNNSMAKAGSGDVLTGMIAGLLAQGMDNFEAAALGVYLHGLCGDIAAANLTKYSVMATDLIDNIPNALKSYSSKNNPN